MTMKSHLAFILSVTCTGLALPPIAFLTFEKEEGYSPEDGFTGDVHWSTYGPASDTIGIAMGGFTDGGQHGFLGAYNTAVTPENAQLQAGANFDFVDTPGGILEISADLIIDVKTRPNGDFFTLIVNDPLYSPLFYLTFFTANGEIQFGNGATPPQSTGFEFPNGSQVTILFTVDFDSGTWGAKANLTDIVSVQPLPAGAYAAGALRLEWADAFTGQLGQTENSMIFQQLYIRERPAGTNLYSFSFAKSLEALDTTEDLQPIFLQGPINQPAVLQISRDLENWNFYRDVSFQKGFLRFQPPAEIAEINNAVFLRLAAP